MRAKALVLVLGIMCVATVADARDDILRLPLADVLSSPDAKAKLDPGVALYFGKQPYATPAARMNVTTANKKTNFFNKSDVEGCEWAFLSAMISLTQYAQKVGGNAVVNIRSNYKNNVFSSETEYECGAGNVTGGTAFIGDVVKLP